MASPDRAQDAPEASGAAAAPAAASGGAKAWLPLIAMILLMPVLAFVMTDFVILPKLQKGLGGSTTASAAAPGDSKGKKEGAVAAKKESRAR